MKVAVVKYNAGNVQSVLFALERLGVKADWTDSPAELKAADKVIFPGVGEAGSAMACLRAAGLDRVMPDLKCPVLGICLGMQLLCRRSEESGTDCMGVFAQEVVRFATGPKVPHMGWNSVTGLKGPLFGGLEEGFYAYFIHSFRAGCGADTAGVTDYGGEFSAALWRDNFYGVQFHPEKSGPAGRRMLENFLSL